MMRLDFLTRKHFHQACATLPRSLLLPKHQEVPLRCRATGELRPSVMSDKSSIASSRSILRERVSLKSNYSPYSFPKGERRLDKNRHRAINIKTFSLQIKLSTLSFKDLNINDNERHFLTINCIVKNCLLLSLLSLKIWCK